MTIPVMFYRTNEDKNTKLFFFFGYTPTAYGILVSWPGIEPMPPALETWES